MYACTTKIVNWEEHVTHRATVSSFCSIILFHNFVCLFVIYARRGNEFLLVWSAYKRKNKKFSFFSPYIGQPLLQNNFCDATHRLIDTHTHTHFFKYTISLKFACFYRFSGVSCFSLLLFILLFTSCSSFSILLIRFFLLKIRFFFLMFMYLFILLSPSTSSSTSFLLTDYFSFFLLLLFFIAVAVAAAYVGLVWEKNNREWKIQLNESVSPDVYNVNKTEWKRRNNNDTVHLLHSAPLIEKRFFSFKFQCYFFFDIFQQQNINDDNLLSIPVFIVCVCVWIVNR